MPVRVRIHKLFQYLLDTAETGFDATVSFSNARAPRLGDFLGALDPELSLDWNNRDFRGLPDLRAHVLRATGLEGRCRLGDVLITAGRRDPIAPAPGTDALARWFEDQGAQVRLVWHPGGHEIAQTEIDALQAFLA
ncbi:MAG: hypothetical protein HLUCCA24_02525 [Rhodobacteraceae bacterium HLUCCA24]|nr:MAG: hypothetical protein HLUCCA24_02525 [Rhodobacteraceae bacterium HLUCCA24]